MKGNIRLDPDKGVSLSLDCHHAIVQYSADCPSQLSFSTVSYAAHTHMDYTHFNGSSKQDRDWLSVASSLTSHPTADVRPADCCVNAWL